MNQLLRNLSLLILFSFLILSCKPDTQQAKPQAQEINIPPPPSGKKDGIFPDWLKNANIYEVNIRQFTKEGTFKGVMSHLKRLEQMGVDVLWLMPIYPISKKKRKGSLGSYYAISDFKDVNPEFGTKRDFKALVDSIHKLRMKVILDFVPNHTGWDHKWISEHPDWYTQDKAGNIIDPIDPSTGKSWGWTDVADLNYDNQDMRKAMISNMEYWVDQFRVDGYRFDVAHNVPDDFWAAASSSLLNKRRNLLLLAEAEMANHRNNSYFHVDYGWSFHHLINDIVKKEKTAADIAEWYKQDRAKYTAGWHMNFTSNHDENSWAGTAFERFGDADKCMTALAFTFDGMPLIYGGQEEPLRKRLEFFEKDVIPFGKYEYSEFYRKLLQLKHINQALWNGQYGAEPKILKADEQLFVFEKTKGANEFIGIFNLSDTPATYKMHRSLQRYENVPAGKRFDSSKDQELSLGPWSYIVLSNI